MLTYVDIGTGIEGSSGAVDVAFSAGARHSYMAGCGRLDCSDIAGVSRCSIV